MYEEIALLFNAQKVTCAQQWWDVQRGEREDKH